MGQRQLVLAERAGCLQNPAFHSDEAMPASIRDGKR